MIVAFTPCPCLDRLVLLEDLKPGHLHRPQAVEERAGGKGLNLVRSVVRMGGQALAVAPLGGWSGGRIRRLAGAEGLPLLVIKGRTSRLCHILLHPGGPTEIYEPCPPMTKGVLRRMAEAAPSGIRVLSGSLPRDWDPREVIESLRPYAVDSGPAFPVVLRERDLGVGLIKPNRQELAALHPGPPLEAAIALNRAHGVRVLASLGPEGAVYAGPEGVWVARGPTLQGNPVGSGDALLGGFLLAQSRGLSIPESLAYGVAAGTANLVRGGGYLDPTRVAALLREVEVRDVVPGGG